MDELEPTATAFIAMAHRIVWATVATVDTDGRPRTRILHPIWAWDDTGLTAGLTGWIATAATPVKRAHLARQPNVSVSYWSPDHDTCAAECTATWLDTDGQVEVWQRFAEGPEPVGYDPAIVPAWADGPRSPAFGALRLDPWRLRVFPGTVLLGQGGTVLSWGSPGAPDPARSSRPV